ncbi:permease [Thioflexithrix psekupsensis]|uniref:Permease n=1 Tax=Thioflexithrix psekupsensis TaxID=1570016 RepID=A0A251XCN2_9GAMM|nr:permease [Thioflexithrix psekupsensis]OUD15675.1 hypothetical protein TPSD3_03920 [Thioflexithrix psekupsensis]
MFSWFTILADWLTYRVLGLSAETNLSKAIHFFIEDTTKILVLLVVMIYIIALIRASLDVTRVRYYLAGKSKILGTILGSIFGAITPFCSCSSIPVFLGFTSAGIPVGVTMSFLLTSPLINEVAVLLLLSLLGWQFTLTYVIVGMLVGILGGLLLEFIHAERWLQPFVRKAYDNAQFTANYTAPHLSFAQRHDFAKTELIDIFSRVWKWVIIGVGLGAALHGFVPENWLEQHLGEEQWWSVPLAVLLGIPLYANATGIIPIMEGLITKGLPVGTTLAFCMSTVAASFPEFIMLKQVMQWRLLLTLFIILLVAFTLIGWLFNFLHFIPLGVRS